jgi:hypothetical protein
MRLVMTEGPIEFEPQRIADEIGEAGGLLRRAQSAFLADLSESRAFRRLERRRRRSARIRTFAAIGTLAMAAGGLTAWFHQEAFRNTSSAQAEPLPAAPSAFKAEPEKPLAVPASLASNTAVVSSTSRKETRTRELVGVTVPTPAVAAPQQAVPSEAQCQEEYKARAFQRAADCFRARTSGAGVEAEVAFYRAARIQAESLNDPRRALALIDEHRARFPAGVMRGEVELLRVRSLNQSGRYDDALSTSEALLGTPAGRALSSELHLLRGQIFQDRKRNCAAAASEFVALIGEPGRLGDEAELRRAGCLEELGRSSDARLAYQQYLRRNNPISADKARQRLSLLENAASDEGGVR